MPYIITRMNGKPFKLQTLFSEEEIDRLRGDGNHYVIVNTVTRARRTVNGPARVQRRREVRSPASR